MNRNLTTISVRGNRYRYVGQRGLLFSLARRLLHAGATLAVGSVGLLLILFAADIAAVFDPAAIIESLGVATDRLLRSETAMLYGLILAPLGGLGLAWKLRAHWASRQAEADLGTVQDLTATVRAWAQDYSPFRCVDDSDESWARDASTPGNSLIIDGLGQVEAWRAAWTGAWTLTSRAERHNAQRVDQLALELARAAELRARELGFDPFGYGLQGPDWNDPSYGRRRKSRQTNRRTRDKN